MIDTAFFLELNSNYTRPHINKLRDHDSSYSIWFSFNTFQRKQIDKVKGNSMEPIRMNDNDLIICSLTMLRFSFGDKQWSNFCVSLDAQIHEGFKANLILRNEVCCYQHQ